MSRQGNSFTRDLDFLTQKRGYSVQAITGIAKDNGWTFTQAVMVLAEKERGGAA